MPFKDPDARRRYQRLYYRDHCRAKRLEASRRYQKRVRSQWQDTRLRIFTRDNFTCRYCHKRFDATVLTIDHVIARHNGGVHNESNFATACRSCNSSKQAHPLCSNCGTWKKPTRVDDDTIECARCGERNTFPPSTPAFDPRVEPSWVTEENDEDSD